MLLKTNFPILIQYQDLSQTVKTIEEPDDILPSCAFKVIKTKVVTPELLKKLLEELEQGAYPDEDYWRGIVKGRTELLKELMDWMK